MTTVVNIKRGEPYDVYIGRPGRGFAGPFGNPILVGRACPVCGMTHDRGGTLVCFRALLERAVETDAVFRRQVRELSGKRLGCFCAPMACHGDHLAEVADLLAGSL